MEELDIKELLYEFWRKKVIIILILVIGIALGVIYSELLVKPMYKSTTTLVLSKPTNKENTSGGITSNDVSINQKLVSTYSEIIKSRSVASEVIEELNLSMTEEEMGKLISVKSKKDTELLEISVSNSNPEMAASIANTLAEEFAEKIKEVYKIENVSVIDEARISEKPYNINLKKTVIIFAVGSLFLTGFIIIVAFYLNDTFKSPEEVEKALGLSVLAVIPKVSEKE